MRNTDPQAIYRQIFLAWPPRQIEHDTRDAVIADNRRIQTPRTYHAMRFHHERNMPGRGNTSYTYAYEQARINQYREQDKT